MKKYWLERAEVYLGSSKLRKWSFFYKIVNGLAANYFQNKTLSQIFSRVLNTPLKSIRIKDQIHSKFKRFN